LNPEPQPGTLNPEPWTERRFESWLEGILWEQGGGAGGVEGHDDDDNQGGSGDGGGGA